MSEWEVNTESQPELDRDFIALCSLVRRRNTLRARLRKLQNPRLHLIVADDADADATRLRQALQQGGEVGQGGDAEAAQSTENGQV